MKKRVVVTGLGAITPLGLNVKDFWNSIKAGKSGVDYITQFDTADYKTKIAAEVKDFDPKEYLDRRSAKRMDRFAQFGVVASEEAVKDSGIDLESVDKFRFGVIVGSGMGGLETIEKESQKLVTKGPNRVAPLFIPRIISNMAAGNIAIKFGAKGVCTNVVTACATGSHCIGDAFKVIQDNRADIMICGGAESTICPSAIAGFQKITAVSTSENPEKASRPFDANRDGFVMGEGAGILILESLEHAQQRGAKIYAEIVGYGATCDAYHLTTPAEDAEGSTRAMQVAIEDAEIQPEEVSYINAHGTSTSYNDRLETLAIKNVFGDKAYDIPVSSTKSMIGHLLGAAGGVESIVCIKSLQEQYVTPTINYETKDENCDLDYVPNVGREAELNYALTNSLGFGGHNATLLFKRWE